MKPLLDRKWLRPVIVVCIMFAIVSRWGPTMPDSIRSTPQPVVGAAVDLSAPDILAKMADAYAGCSSYQDEGVVWDDYSGSTGFQSSRPFATSFVRGGGFRFEYRSQSSESLLSRILGHGNDRRVIWGDDRRARRWTSDGGSSEASLDLQLGGEAGVSGRASKTIPRLLLPDILGGRRIDALENPTVVAIEALDGRTCYRIEAGQAASRETMWIDTESYLLRRMQDVDDRVADTTVISTTAYSPRLNVEIDPTVFAFQPPG